MEINIIKCALPLLHAQDRKPTAEYNYMAVTNNYGSHIVSNL